MKFDNCRTDGKISLAEYIGDMYHQDDAEEDGGHAPEWVTAEKEQFAKYTDSNNDGFMDKDEVSCLTLDCKSFRMYCDLARKGTEHGLYFHIGGV